MQFMAWKAGMDIAVRHILQKDLPPNVRVGAAVPLGAPLAGAPAAAAPAPAADAAAPAAGAAAAPAAPPAAAAIGHGEPGAAGSEARAPAGHGEAGGAVANGSAKPPLGAGSGARPGGARDAAAAGAKRPRDEGAGAGGDRGQGSNPDPGPQAAGRPDAAALLAERAAKARRLGDNPAGSVVSVAQAAAPAAAPAAPGGGAPSADVGRGGLGIKAAGPARGGSEDGEGTSRAPSELALDDLVGNAQARCAARRLGCAQQPELLCKLKKCCPSVKNILHPGCTVACVASHFNCIDSGRTSQTIFSPS